MTAAVAASGWWRRHAGVRVRTALTAAAVVAATLVAAGVLLVVLLERNLADAVDQSTAQRARDIAAAITRDGVAGVGRLDGSTERSVVQILRDGQVLASTAEIDGEPALRDLRPGPGELRTDTGRVPVGDDPHRIVMLGVRSSEGDSLVVLVSQSLEPVENSSEVLESLLLAGVPLLVLLVGGATFVLTGRALRPVEAIRQRVAGIGGQQLGQRVPVPPARDEVGRLAETMNDMLGRLESSASAQRRFVSDASHELRSPLATVRTSMEVAQAHPHATDWAGLTEVVLGETARMQALVADMLLLARSDEGSLRLRRTDVDLDDLCEQEAARLRRAGVRVVTDVMPVRVVGDPEGLARMLRNLADNAARHAEGRVDIVLRAEAGSVLLEVGDDGPGIPPDQREHVFERFVRLDDSRTRSSGGTGLGLAIVAQIVQAHHGVVVVADGPSAGARLQVALPLP